MPRSGPELIPATQTSPTGPGHKGKLPHCGMPPEPRFL